MSQIKTAAIVIIMIFVGSLGFADCRTEKIGELNLATQSYLEQNADQLTQEQWHDLKISYNNMYRQLVRDCGENEENPDSLLIPIGSERSSGSG